MALNIKDDETGAIRTALKERRERLILERTAGDRVRGLQALLEEEIWPAVPPDMLGRGPSPDEQEAILGYGPEGL